MTTALPAGSVAVFTDWRRNASWLELSCGTSFAFADCTLGAFFAGCQLSVIVFSLSEKETDDPCVFRDHPSGTVTVNPPDFDVYGTNWVLSGMSPGGFVSGATGDWWGIGVAAGLLCAECCGLGGIVAGAVAAPAWLLVEFPPPQAALAKASPARSSAIRVFTGVL